MNIRSNTKKLTMNALLIGIGIILHQLTPAIGLPMQPDFTVIMLFIIILLNDDFKTSILSGGILGVFSALSTKFPGGQLPNIIDKLGTAFIMFFVISIGKKMIEKKVIKIKNERDNIFIGLIMSIGTFISGVLFLLSASFIVGLPVGFNTLLLTIVLPTTILNAVVGIVIYKVVCRSVNFKLVGSKSV